MRKAPLIVIAFAAIAVGGAAGSKWLPAADTDRPLGLLDEALTIVHDAYVDEVPWAKLVSVVNFNALAPSLPHAYAPVPRPSRPQPRTPPPRWSPQARSPTPTPGEGARGRGGR